MRGAAGGSERGQAHEEDNTIPNVGHRREREYSTEISGKQHQLLSTRHNLLLNAKHDRVVPAEKIAGKHSVKRSQGADV